ncbi:hypothetical protein ACFQ3F_07480 [Nocardioides ginsengisoli]|uniref:Terpene cyclase/mutase family protein n=1 Tax=Nocardioides ginsengisoli TaxID=363868 RepID=A0ABW3VY11_9ACTN
MLTSRPVRILAATGLVLTLGLAGCKHENDDKVVGDSTTATPEAALAGAHWLEGQLRDGVLYNEQYKTDDYSTTVDLAYAVRAVDPSSKALSAIATALAGGIDAYAKPGKDVYSGSLAKLVSFAEDQGQDPRAFGGQDLVAQLEARTADGGATAGRISDKSSYGDYANSFGQAWAVRGLTLAGSKEATAARDFLLEQQCSEGFFRLYFAAPNAADQTCDSAGAKPEPVDTTALAYVLLHDLAEHDDKLATALDRGIDYIKGQQAADGSFSGGSGDAIVPNSNSTGLAGWALHLAGEDAAAAKAATWVRQHQVGACDGPMAKDAGAIAFDDAAMSGAAKGVTKKAAYQWRLSTAQSLPSLLAVPTDAAEAPCPDAS